MIFISHSSRNNIQAREVRDWLLEQGWGSSQIFLDTDNLVTGDRWRVALNESSGECEAIIACLSDDWLHSPECLREFNFAESTGRPIFPIVVAPVSERMPRFITDLQITDLMARKDEGFAKLKAGLLAARVSPEYFPWPPKHDPYRLPYRGLDTLDIDDAAVYFGRDASIVKGLNTLRLMRDSRSARLLVILGASGCGKSSYLRAGLLPRLKRDSDRFRVLPVVRPERAPMSGPAGIAAALRALRQESRSSRKNAVSVPDDTEEPVLSRDGQFDTPHAHGVTAILPIDQGEELFASGNEERSGALAALTSILTSGLDVVVIMTLRSDSLGELQNDAQLGDIERVPFDLPRMSTSAFRQVIEGPGQMAQPSITFEPALVETLAHDLNDADALLKCTGFIGERFV